MLSDSEITGGPLMSMAFIWVPCSENLPVEDRCFTYCPCLFWDILICLFWGILVLCLGIFLFVYFAVFLLFFWGGTFVSFLRLFFSTKPGAH